jgi:hypothetical protein
MDINEQNSSPGGIAQPVPAQVADGFDAASLDTKDASNQAVEIEIKHPTTGLGTGIFISVLGKDSDAYRNRIRAMANENLQKEARGMKLDVSLDKLEAKNLDALVGATTAWRTNADHGYVMLRGERLAFNPANVRKLYADILPIREQVAEAINDLSLFIKG